MIDDVGLAISLVGVGAYGINKIGKAISTLKNGKNLANVANSTQGKLPMNLQYFAKDGSKTNIKGKIFRGGSKSQRDNWYGKNDKVF